MEEEDSVVNKLNFNPGTTQSIVNKNQANTSSDYNGFNVNQPFPYNGPLNYSAFTLDNKLFSFLK
jgi:hypothetical protein